MGKNSNCNYACLSRSCDEHNYLSVSDAPTSTHYKKHVLALTYLIIYMCSIKICQDMKVSQKLNAILII
jgi:hypothetical protein